MELIGYDDDDRRYVPLIVSVAAVVLTGVLAAGITFLLVSSSQAAQPDGLSALQTATAQASPTASAEEPAEPTGPEAEPAEAASEACTTALVRADAVAQRSTALEQALAEHTRIMDELLAERLTAEQALDETLPVLTRGATERDRFQDELAAYESSRGACTD